MNHPVPDSSRPTPSRRSLLRFLWLVPWWARWVIGVALLVPTLIVAMNLWVLLLSEPYVYRHLEDIPAKRVGLVLGTSHKVRSGRSNEYFTQRMDAAAALYKANKIQHIIVSGDNRTRYYNEPRQMRIALEKRGVPRRDITLDYAGFRTLDSMVRAKQVFGQSNIIVITNDFHLNRAVFIGREHREDVIGFAAGDVGGWNGLRNHLREVAGRVVAFMDVYFLDTQPTFPGPPEFLHLQTAEGKEAPASQDES